RSGRCSDKPAKFVIPLFQHFECADKRDAFGASSFENDVKFGHRPSGRHYNPGCSMEHGLGPWSMVHEQCNCALRHGSISLLDYNPTTMSRALRTLLTFVVLSSLAAVQAQTKITTPKEQFGFNIGDDYVLANYTQYVDYLKKLDRESDRLSLQEIGKSSEGRTMYLAVITSPENQNKLARYKEISERLAHAEGLTDDQARTLAEEGKAVVWIDGGIHASEVLGSQQ